MVCDVDPFAFLFDETEPSPRDDGRPASLELKVAGERAELCLRPDGIGGDVDGLGCSRKLSDPSSNDSRNESVPLWHENRADVYGWLDPKELELSCAQPPRMVFQNTRAACLLSKPIERDRGDPLGEFSDERITQ